MKRWYYLLLFPMLWTGCGEDVEGCLDPNATNFDPSADVSCCCEYPQLTLKLSYLNYGGDSSSFALNIPYNDDNGQVFAVSDLRFYLSGFELVRADNSVVSVTDTIEVMLRNGTLATLTDDFCLVRNSVFKYNIGTTNVSGDFTKIRFKVGLDSIASLVNPQDLETVHPLHSDFGMFSNDSYSYNKIAIIADTSASDIISTYVIDDELVAIELDYNFTINSGFDTEIKINADLKSLLNTVDFQNDDYNTIISKIVTNTSEIFRIVE